MKDILYITLAASFTLAIAISLGLLVIRRLELALSRLEAVLFGFLGGSACLSFAVFFLCLVHQARRGVFLGGGVAVIAWGVWRLRHGPLRKSLPAINRSWTILFYLVFSAFFFTYLINALAPEASPDGMGYHLGNVSRFLRAHGFVWTYHSMYSYLSQGMEMLFLVAFAFGRHSAAAMVHLAFQTALPFLILCYGRRFGFPKAAVMAAILVYVAPLAGIDGSSAYNDIAVATLIFAVFYLLQVWDEIRDDKLLIFIGLLSGFAVAVKYTMGIAVVFAVVFVWWREWHVGRRVLILRSVALLAPVAVMVLPWLLRDWLWLGNPLAPFSNRWFPNPYYHLGMEQIYLEGIRRYTSIKHFWDPPLQLTVLGKYGLIGPAFLLTPLAFVAIGKQQVRRLLLAGLVFLIPAFLNDDPRFVIPSLPFFALALGLGLANTRGALLAVAVFEVIACWHTMVSSWCPGWSWRISEISVRAALRKVPEMDYLAEKNPLLKLKPVLEQAIPPDGKVFSFSNNAEAYINRHIVGSYESTLGNLAYDILLAPVDGYLPNSRQSFRMLPADVRGVRVVQTASAKNFWTLAEVRVYLQGRELARAPGWRLSAWPNPWEVQLAFDNNYSTRWSSWQPMRPRDYVQIDFGRTERVDEVVLESSKPAESQVELDVLTVSGRWTPVTDKPREYNAERPAGMRRAATLELKARGIAFILVQDSDFICSDMKKYPHFWGLTELAVSDGIHFYRID